jgi:maltose-binding protein MalE
VVGSVNGDTAQALFLEGSEPFWITGPWNVNTANDSGINWAVAKLPTIGGQPMRPFVGANGFFLSAFSENKVVAQSFLLDFIATTETMQALYEADPRNPAFQPVFEALGDNQVAQTFALSAADGNPMPNVPEMGAVWGPLGDNLLLLRNGEISSAEAMAAAAAAVRDAVAA